MVPDKQNVLVNYRINSAKDKINASKLLLEAGFFKDSVSKSYYAMFNAVRALLASRDVDFTKHAGVISYFQREYIKTGIFDKKYSNYMAKAFEARNNSDYDDFFIVTKSDAIVQYDRAVELQKVIEEYLNNDLKGGNFEIQR